MLVFDRLGYLTNYLILESNAYIVIDINKNDKYQQSTTKQYNNMIIFTIIIVFVKEKFILWKKNCKKSSVNEHNKHWKAECVSYPEILRKN